MHYIILFIVKNFIKISIVALMLSTNAFAASDGENELI